VIHRQFNILSFNARHLPSAAIRTANHIAKVISNKDDDMIHDKYLLSTGLGCGGNYKGTKATDRKHSNLEIAFHQAFFIKHAWKKELADSLNCV